MKFDKQKIIYSVFCCIFVCIVFFQIAINQTEGRLWMAAMKKGLKDVKISLEDDVIGTTYIIESSNYETRSYNNMLELNEFFSQYTHKIKYSCNGNIYVCDNNLRTVDKNGNEVYNDYENSEAYKKEQEKERERATYADEYPYIDMREEFLPYTILGEPDKVEKCRNFESYRNTRKSKTYTWYETEEHGQWEVTVKYAEWTGTRYKIYPTNNGIVGYMRYNEIGEAPKTVYD